MATLSAGNISMEIHFASYDAECEWLYYHFIPRIDGQPAFNARYRPPEDNDTAYEAEDCLAQKSLLPFLSDRLLERNSGEWGLPDSPVISIHARSWKQDREERAPKNEGRTVFIRYEAGNVSEQPYNEGTAFINPYLDEIMDLTYKFERGYFTRNHQQAKPPADGIGGCVSLTIPTTYDALTLFISDLIDEYKAFINLNPAYRAYLECRNWLPPGCQALPAAGCCMVKEAAAEEDTPGLTLLRRFDFCYFLKRPLTGFRDRLFRIGAD